MNAVKAGEAGKASNQGAGPGMLSATLGIAAMASHGDLTAGTPDATFVHMLKPGPNAGTVAHAAPTGRPAHGAYAAGDMYAVVKHVPGMAR